MPEHSILKINDIFWSFQGEGVRMGRSSVFIRLAGCSMNCTYCDTKESWGAGISVPLERIVEKIGAYMAVYPDSQVVITGGEPLEQDISQFVNVLQEMELFVSIETNGSRYQGLPINWWTVSPKHANGFGIHPALVNKINEIKLVTVPQLTPDIVRNIRNQVPNVPIFLQPESGDQDRYQNTFDMFSRCQKARLDNIRCGLQMHKIYNVK